MLKLDGTLMSGNKEIAIIKNGVLITFNNNLLPLYVKRTKNLEQWLEDRAIDSHRTNSRILKKALRLRASNDAEVSLSVNAATITDNYWIRTDSSTYNDVRFEDNTFANIALYGDFNDFNQEPKRTPELTNIGSFEKCWKLVDGVWWLYKKGTKEEYFSEMFISCLCKEMGFDGVAYEMDGAYIRCRDYTNGNKVNAETLKGLMEDEDDYELCFQTLEMISEKLAKQYLCIIWMDTLCFNVDRHTENISILRDIETGDIISMAPNYDNNLSLISRGYSDVSREKDGIIRLFGRFLEGNQKACELLYQMNIPKVSKEMIARCYEKMPHFEINKDFVTDFILNGQKCMLDIVQNQVRNISIKEPFVSTVNTQGNTRT